MAETQEARETKQTKRKKPPSETSRTIHGSTFTRYHFVLLSRDFFRSIYRSVRRELWEKALRDSEGSVKTKETVKRIEWNGVAVIQQSLGCFINFFIYSLCASSVLAHIHRVQVVRVIQMGPVIRFIDFHNSHCHDLCHVKLSLFTRFYSLHSDSRLIYA